MHVTATGGRKRLAPAGTLWTCASAEKCGSNPKSFREHHIDGVAQRRINPKIEIFCLSGSNSGSCQTDSLQGPHSGRCSYRKTHRRGQTAASHDSRGSKHTLRRISWARKYDVYTNCLASEDGNRAGSIDYKRWLQREDWRVSGWRIRIRHDIIGLYLCDLEYSARVAFYMKGDIGVSRQRTSPALEPLVVPRATSRISTAAGNFGSMTRSGEIRCLWNLSQSISNCVKVSRDLDCFCDHLVCHSCGVQLTLSRPAQSFQAFSHHAVIRGNETLSAAAMRVSNRDCSPVGINR